MSYFFSFIFGLIIGSFLNCLIWRLYQEESIWGRSYCPYCKKQIVWYDNIPLLSFIFLKGRCRYCKQKISWQYPAVELVTALFFVLVAYWQGFSLFNFNNYDLILLIRNWFLISVFIIIFIFDFKYYLVPVNVLLPASFLALLFNLFLGFDLWNLLISGIIGAGFFVGQFLISKIKIVRKRFNNKDFIGEGDIYIGLFIGFAFALPSFTIVAIFLAYLIGTLIFLPFLLFNPAKLKTEIPLGVFLSISSVIVLFWGQAIVNWYFKLLLF